MIQASRFILSPGLFVLSLYLLTMPSLLASECSWLLSRLNSVRDSISSDRSASSLTYWASSRRTRPLSYAEWASQTDVTYIRGLPTFESRPTKLGFTDWVFSFGRAHKLNQEFIMETERQMNLASQRFKEVMALLKKGSSNELEDELANLASKVQYYREMNQALTGEILPYAEQGPSALNQFLEENRGGSEIHLHEAQIRLWEVESKMIAHQRLDTSTLTEMLPLMREINFYKEAVQKISENLNSKTSTISEYSMTQVRLP